MRIIAGSCKGRRLQAPGRRFAACIRPTSDRAREALFNIIGPEATGAAVLDLFAGTGALGLEALSRGAATALFVEADPEVCRLLQANIELCRCGERARVLRRDCAAGLGFLPGLTPPGGFGLVLADPPYGRELAAATLNHLATLGVQAAGGILAPEALVVLETGRQEELPSQVGALQVCRQSRRYGEARFHFYRQFN